MYEGIVVPTFLHWYQAFSLNVAVRRKLELLEMSNLEGERVAV